MTMRIFLLITCGFVAALVAPHTAVAHKVIASAYASGDTIEGEIGFSNGEMAANTKVVVTDDRGATLGETITDGDGFFVFTPTQTVIHVFEANLGAGHVARAKLSLEELPDITPNKAAGTSVAPVVPAGDTSTSSAKSQSATSPAQTGKGAAAVPAELITDQRDLMLEMIRKELRPLRREIAAYKEKNNLQTILGGIGYIFGLFGLWFFFAARRRLSAASQVTQSAEGKASP